MRLRTLGVSGSSPRSDSPASTYLVQVPADVVAAGVAAGTVPADVEVRDWNIVVDLGNGGLGHLLRHVELHRIDAVLISHLHPDHCADLSGLYVHLKYHPEHGAVRLGHAPELPLYGPSNVEERVRAMYGLDPGESMAAIFDFRTFTDGEAFRFGPVEVLPLTVFHPVEAYGLRLTGPSTGGPSRRPGERVVLAYTGDTDYCPNVVEVARDADLLLAEAAFVTGRDDEVEAGVHLTGERAGHVAVEAHAARLLLTHLPAWTDPEQVLAEARSVYTGPVALAEPDGSLEI